MLRGQPLKLLLLVVLIALFPTLLQVEREEPELRVVKFSWAREKENHRMIRGAQNPGGPITTPMTDSQDLSSRRVDFRVMEKKAVVSAEKPVDNYQLHLELKNTGANEVRGLSLGV